MRRLVPNQVHIFVWQNGSYGRFTAASLWLLELSPVLLSIVLVLTKLICFNLALEWREESGRQAISQWLMAHPYLLISTLAILFITVAPLLFISRTWRFILLIAGNFLVSMIVLANLIHFRFYWDVVSVSSYLNATMLPWVFSSVVALLEPTDSLLFLDIALLLILVLLRRVPSFLQPARLSGLTHRQVSLFGLSIAFTGVVMGVPAVQLMSHDRSIINTYESAPIDVVMTIGLLPYHVSDVILFLTARPLEPTTAQIEAAKQYISQKNSTLPPSPLFGVARGKNVIMISAESLQAFPINLQINGQLVTPNLQLLAAESLQYVNFYDQTHLGTTSDGQFTSLQSLHPLSRGTVAFQYNQNDYYGLPAILAQHGYTTLAAVAAPAGFWRMDRLNPRFGFQYSYYEDSYRPGTLIGEWLADDEFFSQTVPILEKQDSPFMTYLFSSSNHHPFELPAAYRGLQLGELADTLVGNYLNSVHYFDHALGEFVDRLRVSGLLDQSVLVVFGDHSPHLHQPTTVARLLGLSETNQYQNFLIEKNIPLLIRLPHGAHAGLRANTGGHLDIAPTILTLLGIPFDRYVLLGSDLSSGRHALVTFRDGSLVEGEYLALNGVGSLSAPTCYSVHTSQTVDCLLLEEQRLEAFRQLEVSDLIVRGDLIPELMEQLRTDE